MVLGVQDLAAGPSGVRFGGDLGYCRVVGYLFGGGGEGGLGSFAGFATGAWSFGFKFLGLLVAGSGFRV